MGITVCGRFFEYMHLPFGYNNSPHEFLQALWPTMRWIQDHTASQVLFYMDDILLLFQSTEDHYRDLQVVMEGLRKDGWKLNWSKCQFFKEKFSYLGVTLTPTGMIPADSVLQQFKEAQMPTTLQGWRRVIGWLAHSTKFLYQGHCLLGQLQHLRISPSAKG